MRCDVHTHLEIDAVGANAVLINAPVSQFDGPAMPPQAIVSRLAICQPSLLRILAVKSEKYNDADTWPYRLNSGPVYGAYAVAARVCESNHDP